MYRFSIYAIVQIAAYGLDIGCFAIIFSAYGKHAIYANTISKLVSGSFSFFAHRHATFKQAENPNFWPQAIKYYGFLLINAPTTTSLLYLINNFLSSTYSAKIIADIIYAIGSYFISKHLIFSCKKKTEEPTHYSRENKTWHHPPG